MWPNEVTLNLLILNLLPLVYLLCSAVRFGYAELVSLRTVGIFFIWLGYSLSPFLSFTFQDGKWPSFLLAKNLIDSGLLFSLLFSIAYIIGFNLIYHPEAKRETQNLLFPAIKTEFIILLIFLSISFFLIHVGGFSEAWQSKFPRGYGQFIKRGLSDKFQHMAGVLSTPINVLLATVASLLILQERKTGFDILRFVSGIIGIIVSSLQHFHSFSRGAGSSFIIFSLLVIRIKGARWIPLALIAALIGYQMGSVGLNRRGEFKPGISSFCSALVKPGLGTRNNSVSRLLSPENNPLDAMAAWSRKAQARNNEKPDPILTGFKLVLNLHPFPSELVPLFQIGKGLEVIMKTKGHTGITTPTLAELYYVFWFFGSLAGIPIGAAMGWFERQNAIHPKWYSQVAILLCFLSLPISLHTNLRSMTRLLFYALLFFVLAKKVDYKRMRSRYQSMKFSKTAA